MRRCARDGVSIVPQGGNTGLVGGGVPDDSRTPGGAGDARLPRSAASTPTTRRSPSRPAACCRRCRPPPPRRGLLFPLSLAAEGSCTIGGNLATNAGGTQVLRFGNARELCLGLEVVTAQGELWSGLHGLRKDNTGYDLRDLFVGSEGTLGIITAATLRLFPQPRAGVTALGDLPTLAAAWR